jgi:hypothetical protein
LRNRLAMAGQATIHKIRMRIVEDFRVANQARKLVAPKR